MKIYVASSWRNTYQPKVVNRLRCEGHEVYNFRTPCPGNNGFKWSEIDLDWQDWNQEQYRKALWHSLAVEGYDLDFNAMKEADTCVLVLPCGRSAHLEAGYFAGAGKPLHILILEPCDPELMYKMAIGIYTTIDELIRRNQWEK